MIGDMVMAARRLFAYLVVMIILLFSPGGAKPQAAEAEFVVRRMDGATHRGSLLGIGPNGTLRLGDPPRELPREDVLWVRRVGGRLPEPPAAPYVLGVNGDRIPVASMTVDRAGLRLMVRGREMSKAWTLPLSELRGVWLAEPIGAELVDAIKWKWEHESRAKDVVLLRNGDTLDGLFEGITEAEVRVRIRDGVEAVPRDRVAAVGLRAIGRQPPRRDRLHLADGTRLSVASVALRPGESLNATSVHGGDITIPLADLVALERYHPGIVFLSDLEPVEYKHEPYLDTRWPLVRDGSVAWRPLRIGGHVFDKGLGMHSRAEVTYDLPNGAQWFAATIGLDDRTGRNGNVLVRILVDGSERDRHELDGGKTATEIRVALAGARRLTLRLDFGRGGDVGDDFNWGEAMLVVQMGR